MRYLLRILIYVVSLGVAFAGGYRLTDLWFRARLVPYPFELYGIAVGIALACFGFALLQLVDLLWSRRSARRKAGKAYAVKVNRISEVELFR